MRFRNIFLITRTQHVTQGKTVKVANPLINYIVLGVKTLNTEPTSIHNDVWKPWIINANIDAFESHKSASFKITLMANHICWVWSLVRRGRSFRTRNPGSGNKKQCYLVKKILPATANNHFWYNIMLGEVPSMSEDTKQQSMQLETETFTQILFVWCQSFIVKSSGQISWQT